MTGRLLLLLLLAEWLPLALRRDTRGGWDISGNPCLGCTRSCDGLGTNRTTTTAVGTKEGTDEQKGCIYVSKVHLRTKLLGNAWHLRRGSLKSSLEAGWSLDSFSTDVLYGSMFRSKRNENCST
uniref:RxLR effector candidate protein n=1 Tax=Hyaloperonospora arabidopsidis (strain Emoy2) TaxID=559515 RepID=M4C266_HYAAE